MMAWKFGAVAQSGAEAALDVCDYFTDDEVIEQQQPPIKAYSMKMDTTKSAMYSTLKKAIISGNISSVKSQLIEFGDDKQEMINMTPTGENSLLFLACQLGHIDIVKLLFEAGADGRTHTFTQYTCLYAAIHNGHKQIVRIILENIPELIQEYTAEQWSPLHVACINGHTEIVNLLINFPYPENLLQKFKTERDSETWECRIAFDPNLQDVTGQTPLYVACLLGNTSLVLTLLDWKTKYTKINTQPNPNANNETATTSSDDQLVSPPKRRVAIGIQHLMNRLYFSRDKDETNETDMEQCPLDLNILCGAPKETALLAAVRGGYKDVILLLLQNGADPNIIARPMDDHSLNEEMYGFSNSPLAEATSQKTNEIIDLLLKHGANDETSSALAIACANNDDHIIGRLLSKKSHTDPEYKVNKKKMDNSISNSVDRSSTSSPTLTNITYSNLFPTNPIMINWHFNSCQLSYIRVRWLLDAVQQYNPKLKINPNYKSIALGAITRIDISHNCLVQVPQEIFNLCSLRYLNIAHNKLEKLPSGGSSTSKSTTSHHYDCPMLEELYLQNNRLEDIPPAIFQLPSLITFDISNNKLQKIPYEMWKSKKLRDLNVAFNLLKDLPSLSSIQDIPVAVVENHNTSETSPFQQLNKSNAHQRKNRITKLELQHHSIWSKNLEITEQDLMSNDSKTADMGQLTNLNLANNLFTSIPLALPCLAINLTRLNMSYNSLRSMGHVTSYPASLRQLDLSHNEITCWPSLPRITVADPHLACYNYQEKSNSPFKAIESNSSDDAMNDDHQSRSNNSLRNAVLKSVCSHRKHLRLESLRTLILADNLLSRIQLTTDDIAFNDIEESDWSVIGITKLRLLFPNLSMLDISNNCLKEIPHSLHELNNLSVLNISGNVEVTDLPSNMGLLSRLWNLNTRGCSLQGPLRSMIDNGKYKTMDIIGYLKSVYEDAKPYARMKLMVVGIQGIGKTSLLDLLRQESPVRSKKTTDHWTKRMGNNMSSSKSNTNISTVGVDISDWVCEKKVRGHSQYGPVIFRTWDFGGQKEYYTTHQYFLSKRSLYIVVWRIIDGKRGLSEVLQWLGNIQARAPNSPVIIVGTHYDAIGETISEKEATKLQQIIRDRFIAVTDAEKMGLPKVLDSIEVSCRSHHNIALLANLIYDIAFSLKSPGSKELLLNQKVPSTYLALEDIIGNIALYLKQIGQDPVLSYETYKQMIMQEMLLHNHKGFRDWAELNQATMFLHDNGVILHYDDATLKDLYFIDPQWLCDMLAHVVTIREINPFAKNGIMKLDDLQHIFKSSCMASNNQNGYIVNLLNKFEVALSWDSRTLLIPSLLPTGEQTTDVNNSNVTIKIAARTKSWSFEKADLKIIAGSDPLDAYNLYTTIEHDRSITRLLLMSYFPSGFWSRLLTRVLADGQIVNALANIYPYPRELYEHEELNKYCDVSLKWELWQTGLSLYNGQNLIFKMREIPFHCKESPYRIAKNQFQLRQDGSWCPIPIHTSSILEIYFPLNKINIEKSDEAGKIIYKNVLEINRQCLTHILALCVDHIDILLEDWYPTLGTRFVHTSEGRFLVTRLIPCPKCLRASILREEDDDVVQTNKSNSIKSPDGFLNYSWMMEECILAVYEKKFVNCPIHGDFNIDHIAPDIMFLDLKDNYLIKNEDIVKGPLLGRGAFGFVFKATCKLKNTNDVVPIAMKMLQPVQPGPRAKETAILAYKAVLGKWKRDPLQHSCKAYCMARQELAVILILKHPNIVSLVGVCVQPLALVLEWAPKGALDEVIREFRRSGSRIGPYCLQSLVLQASRAIEYLHRKHIIYRDLKAENVLVWDFPQPHEIDSPANKVYIKVADYGISRVTLPSGTKGFGGTEGFMAPEIMKHNGEEEYTEKVDCFSFGMFLYELIALRQPFEGHEAVKECILEGGRPVLSRRETKFPCYFLDLMVLCWDQQPKNRPSASQIVSIASAPEFTHLIDVVSLSHGADIQAANVSFDVEDDANFEVWISSLNSRIELLVGCKEKWHSYQRISPLHQPINTSDGLKLTAICSVGSAIWIGDSESNIYAFRTADCSHIFTYALEPTHSSPVVALVNLTRINRVAAGLENGRLFLLDSEFIPTTSEFGEGSFVLTELGTGSELYSCCVIWNNDEECELWCGVSDASINIFSMKDSVVSERQTLTHFQTRELLKDFSVSILYPSDEYVYSYVSPGCILYQWNCVTKTVDNRLDCSKLVPCSESLRSISIEEHLSPGKCQITALCKFNLFLYVGTSWGCIVVIEHDTLRPITIFRPYEDEVKCIIPITAELTSQAASPLIATFGKGYRSLIRRYTDTINDKYDSATDRSNNIHALMWKAEHWIPV